MAAIKNDPTGFTIYQAQWRLEHGAGIACPSPVEKSAAAGCGLAAPAPEKLREALRYGVVFAKRVLNFDKPAERRAG